MHKFSDDRWKKVGDELKTYRLDTVVYFGKYKGATIRQMIESDHRYVRYLIDECDKELDNDTYEFLERFE